MEKKLTILSPFFENPNKHFGIRELSRILKINHTTIRQILLQLVKENILLIKKERIYSSYSLNFNRKSSNLKLYYNLEKIRKSKIIEDLENTFDLPTIILFGSFAQAIDDDSSDIDICIIANFEKKFSTEKYEKILNRKVSLHLFTLKSFNQNKKSNPHLINSICNGIILSGELLVL